MKESTPFLGSITTDRNQVFSGIKSFQLKAIQDPDRYYCKEQWQRESHYTKSNIPKHEQCKNPRCRQGGLDLQEIVLFSSTGEYKIHCGGHEGTPTGRHKGDRCGNWFTVTIEVEKD